MPLVVDDGFETLLPAAELLGKYGKADEATDFIRRRVKAVPWDSDAKVQLARTIRSGSAERGRLLTAAVTNGQATYKLRAEAARMTATRPVAGVAGIELALVSSASVTPDAGAKPYQVEARIEAAREAANPEVKLRLWREALALAPYDERTRLGALSAAIALRRDNLALALEQTGTRPLMGFDAGMPYYSRRGRYLPYPQPGAASILPQAQLTDQERAGIAESLAAAAERLDDLPTALRYLRTAISLRPPAQRDALARHLNALITEQDRRAKNTARQPLIKN